MIDLRFIIGLFVGSIAVIIFLFGSTHTKKKEKTEGKQ